MNTLRILIVEDDVMIGMLLAMMLEEMGHTVCANVQTEADAVAAAARSGPDLMIVDAWLRDGNGISAVEKICSAKFVPHFFVSGDIAGVRALRPDAVLVQKPFREAELDQGIKSALIAAAR